VDEGYRNPDESASESAHKPTFWAAPDLAKQGYPTFPIGRDKQPSVAGGFYAATTDLSQLAEWIEEGRGEHDVAFATGLPSGVVVIDADTPKTYAWMLRHCGEPHVKTKRGGHWYFRHPQDGKVISTALGAGLDCKGDGGYVLAPPSLGRTWTDGIPDRVVLPKLPDKLRPKAATPGGSNGSGDYVGDAIPDGARNKTLTSLGGSMRRRGMGEAEIEAALLVTNEQRCKPPLSAAEVAKIAASVARYEPAPNGSVDAPKTAEEQDEPAYKLTDWGNAQRFIRDHGSNVRYCHPWGKWLVYDGKRWRIDDSGEVVRLMKDTVRGIYIEAGNEVDDKKRKALDDHARKSESKTRITDALYLARTEPGVPVSPEELDADVWVFNIPNGTLDLRSMELREHRREDLITKIGGAPYDPDAKAPRFEQFINEVFEGDEGLIAFVQRFAGYSLTGSIEERAFAILHGTGKNGKTTLVELLRDVLMDYAKNTETETVLRKRHAGISNDVAALKGARFVSAAEVEKGRTLAESKVKNLTGTDTVTARFLFAEPFDFRPEFKLWLSTNHKPEIRGTDDAIWDRIKLIPFAQRFTGEKADRSLPRKLREELPGVLAWMVRGCANWQRNGLGESEKVDQATQGYRTEMDALAAFIEERCIVGPNLWCKFADLYAAYTKWCEESHEHPESSRRFADSLTERGFAKDAGPKNVKIRRGIALGHDGGPDPGGVTDPRPDQGKNEPHNTPQTEKNGNRVTDPQTSVTRENSCKTKDSEKRVTEGYRESTTLGHSAPRREGSGKTVTNGNFGNFGNPEGEKTIEAEGHSGGWFGGPDKAKREYTSAEEMLANPPAWLAQQLVQFQDDPERWLRPTASALSNELYGTYERWQEVATALNDYISEDL